MLHITFSKYDCIIVHKAYYLFTCTCVSINSFHSHSHSHISLVPWRSYKDRYKSAAIIRPPRLSLKKYNIIVERHYVILYTRCEKK